MREDLQAINQSRARPAEILGAVDHINSSPTGLPGGSPSPGTTATIRHVLQRPLDAEPAAGDHDHLRLPRHDFLPPQRPRRLSFLAQSLVSSRQPHQLRAPVPARERRVDPFQQHDPRPRARSPAEPTVRNRPRSAPRACAMTELPRASSLTLAAAPTSPIAFNTSARLCGSRFTMRGAFGSVHTASRTSDSATAQTSQRVCVTIRSGRRPLNVGISRLYRARSVFIRSRTRESTSRLDASAGILVRVTLGSRKTDAG